MYVLPIDKGFQEDNHVLNLVNMSKIFSSQFTGKNINFYDYFGIKEKNEFY